MADWDEVEGRAKRAGGALTDNEKLQREGEDQEALGEVKDKAGDAKDKAGDAWEDVKEKI
jgi:uncharacterized protein YjbJ (UPF0337 family)